LFELATDGAVVLDGIGAIRRSGFDQVNQYACAFDVPQEFVAQSGAGVSPFDQSWYIGNH